MIETIFSLDEEEMEPGAPSTEEGGSEEEAGEGNEGMPSGEPESRLADGEESEESTAEDA